MIYPMTPRSQSTVSLAPNSTSSRVALGGSMTTTQGTAETVQIIVTSAATATGLHGGTAADIAYIRFGDSTVTATAPNGATPGSIPILPGSIQTFTVPLSVYTHVAAITPATGGALLFFTQGYGV